MNSIVKIAEKIIGRREHSKSMNAIEYMEANINDLWFALLIAYIWILNALLSSRRKS